MYTSIEIKGFRCFKHLTIPKLARINLIGGKNNTGKTALLEALLIHAHGAAPPDTAVPNLYLLRGVGEAEMAALGFRDLFLWLPDEGSATIAARSEDGRDRSVALSCRDAERTERPLDLGQGAARVASPGRLRERANRVLTIDAGAAQASITIGADGNMTQQGHREASLCRKFYLDAGRHLDATYLAQGLSDLRIKRSEEPVIQLLKLVEPRLVALTVESLGGNPVLHTDLNGARLVPLPFAGEGMHALCALAVGLAHVPAGIALIDEFGDGLHYSVLPDVWRAIARAAEELDVQVFATTHSRECVEAAYEATEGMSEETLLYHRLDRRDGEISSVTYERDVLQAAFDTYLEVR